MNVLKTKPSQTFPEWVPAQIRDYFYHQLYSEMGQCVIYPPEVNADIRLKELINFLSYPDIRKIIEKMWEISKRDCIDILYSAWGYSYAWDHESVVKYKAKHVIGRLREVKFQLAKFREIIYPKIWKRTTESNINAHVGNKLTTSTNIIFKKYIETRSNNPFAKLLNDNAKLLEDCNSFPNFHQLLDIFDEIIDEKIVEQGKALSFDKYIPEKMIRKNPLDAKKIFLIRILSDKMRHKFETPHDGWVAKMATALLNGEISVTADSVKKERLHLRED